MRKRRSQLREEVGATTLIVAIIIIIAAIGFGGYYFIAGGEEGVAPPREIYTLEVPGENQQIASAWENARGLEEIKFVAERDSYSVLVFMHPYHVGMFNPSKAEWIVIAYSAPDASNKIRVAIVRLDYQTFHLKRAYKFSYPKLPELTSDEAVAIAAETASVEENRFTVELLGGNYICCYSLGDFMGTIIVNRYVGEPIFYATTVWAGTGSLIIPEP
jgi:hypothetical protein